MFEWIFSAEMWIALATLIGLEIVLGIDNIIFIAILVGDSLRKKDKEQEFWFKFGDDYAFVIAPFFILDYETYNSAF